MDMHDMDPRKYETITCFEDHVREICEDHAPKTCSHEDHVMIEAIHGQVFNYDHERLNLN